MNKKKRMAIFTLITVLLLSTFLTACGGKKTEGTSGKEDTNNTSSNTSSEQGKETTAKRKLHLLGPNTSNKYIKFEEKEKYEVWGHIQKFLDEANLDLEYELVPAEQYEVVVKTRMASGTDLPDIVNITQLDNTTVLNLAKQGIIQDLNPLIAEHTNGNIKHMYDEMFPYAKALTTSADGKMYWFSNLHQKTYKKTQPAPVAITMLIRKDWLEKLNIPEPTTAEEYLEALREMRKQDANGNGQEDEILVYAPSGFGGPIAQWFNLGTDITAVDVENKKVVSPWYQPGVKEYFKYLQRLVEEGILDTSLIGGSYEQQQQKVTENKVASIPEYNLADYLESTVQGGAEFLPLMPLKAVEGIEPAAVLEPPFLVWQKYAITKNCKDPAAAISFFDIIYSEEYADLSFWGIEGLTYKLNEEGAKVFLQNGTDEEKAKTGQVRGNEIYGDTVFPRVQLANLEYELDPNRVPAHKVEHQLKIIDYKPYFVNMNNNYLAIPNDEQLERKTKILNDLNTYSAELATKLALGQKSLDNWDEYIAELKKLGLDELIKIDQELLDRYNELSGN